jgi:hypothetical protein
MTPSTAVSTTARNHAASELFRFDVSVDIGRPFTTLRRISEILKPVLASFDVDASGEPENHAVHHQLIQARKFEFTGEAYDRFSAYVDLQGSPAG